MYSTWSIRLFGIIGKTTFTKEVRFSGHYLGYKNKQLNIENEVLFESNKQILKKNKLDEDFVVFPPRVFYAFTRWYGKTKELPRRVI